MGEIWGPYRAMHGDMQQELHPQRRRYPSVKEPSTPLGEVAAQMHEMLLAYVGAGFTRDEALQIVIAMVTQSMGPNK